MPSEDFNRLERPTSELKKLGGMSVHVGALKAASGNSESFIEMIAMVNEYGAHIHPKNGQWLTIPTKLADGRKASEIEGLFKPKNHNILAKSNGQGGLDVYFILKKQVDIPERSFMRNTFDQNIKSKWTDRVKFDISKILVGEMRAKELYIDLGRQMVKDVQRAMVKASPSNAPLTIANKGKDKPLFDTGALYRSISWVVEE
ncbi:hypothetical protein [Lactiplantibacillus paraxiangfangensis]|uniref:hypothetical protein n=1 Tax=Lactiplantibacillus paraxiangfangensis TaxID=3076224 RepID=UPI0030C784F0